MGPKQCCATFGKMEPAATRGRRAPRQRRRTKKDGEPKRTANRVLFGWAQDWILGGAMPFCHATHHHRLSSDRQSLTTNADRIAASRHPDPSECAPQFSNTCRQHTSFVSLFRGGSCGSCTASMPGNGGRGRGQGVCPAASECQFLDRVDGCR